MPSKAYGKAIAQMREFHATRKTFSGNGVLKHLGALVKFSAEIGAASGLDYGCGKGAQYGDEDAMLVNRLGYDPYKYDPGVPGFENLPPDDQQFDLVWCVDVLECVPEQDMDWVIAEFAGYAKKGIFVTVASYPAKKTLPNGKNAHITVKPPEWWHAHFAALQAARPDLKIKLLVA